MRFNKPNCFNTIFVMICFLPFLDVANAQNRFVSQAEIAAPNPTNMASFGYSMVSGFFNDDAFADLAVAAPYAFSNSFPFGGEIYVFAGSATGIGTTPILTITPTRTNGNLGLGLTKVRWSSTNRDDLVFYEYSNAGGKIRVLNGGAALPSGSVLSSSAQRSIESDAAQNWFNGGGLGRSLASADHDGDGIDDLIAAVPFGGEGFSAGVLIFFGGTVPLGNVFISNLTNGGSGSSVIRWYENEGSDQFGTFLHAVGQTTGITDVGTDILVGLRENNIANADAWLIRNTTRPDVGMHRLTLALGRDVAYRLVTNDNNLSWGGTVGSLPDLNQDGARDLVFGDYRFGNNNGTVLVMDGDQLGNASAIAESDSVGVTLRRWTSQADNDQFGISVVNNALSNAPDVNGDGNEDLVVIGRLTGSNQLSLMAWFAPITGNFNTPNPDHTMNLSANFNLNSAMIDGVPVQSAWINDLNGDGRDELAISNWTADTHFGRIQILLSAPEIIFKNGFD